MKNLIINFISAFVFIIITIFGFQLKYHFIEIKGDTGIVVEAQQTGNTSEITKNTMDVLKFSIIRRINEKCDIKVNVKKIDKNKLMVIVPKEADVDTIEKQIIKTDKLEIKKPIIDTENNVVGWEASGITGLDIEKAETNCANDGKWLVRIFFNEQGKIKIQQLTKEFTGHPLAFYLNDELIYEPIITKEISGGITDLYANFNRDTVQEMENSLNSSALKVEVKIVEEKKLFRPKFVTPKRKYRYWNYRKAFNI